MSTEVRRYLNRISYLHDVVVPTFPCFIVQQDLEFHAAADGALHFKDPRVRIDILELSAGRPIQRQRVPTDIQGVAIARITVYDHGRFLIIGLFVLFRISACKQDCGVCRDRDSYHSGVRLGSFRYVYNIIRIQQVG